MQQTENRALHGPDLSHLLLPSFEGSDKAAPLTIACFQASPSLCQCQCSKVQGKLGQDPPAPPPSCVLGASSLPHQQWDKTLWCI